MKKSILIFLAFASFAFYFIDVFSELGITKQEAENYIYRSLVSSNFQFPAKCKTIAMPNRPEVVNVIGSLAKAYTKTENFKNEYEKWWLSQAPEKPEKPQERLAKEKEKAIADQLENEKSSLEGINNFKKTIAETKDPALKKQFEEALKTMIATQAEMKKMMESPDYQNQMKEMQKYVAVEYEREFKEKTEKYTTDYKNWQTIKSPSLLIKQRLNQFLEISSDIDFNTKLITKNNRQVFQNETYENKNNNWKLCFRAGKTTIETARLLATNWLKEL
jgi:hypothetical protein